VHCASSASAGRQAGCTARPYSAEQTAATVTQTAPQQAPVTTATTKEPVPGKTTPTAPRPASGSQPVAGRIYLQLSATSRDAAELMVDRLRARNFTAIAAQIPENPTFFRVLVGPLESAVVDRTKADLKAAQFPADEALQKTF
jgi:cell division septation protein DedD